MLAGIMDAENPYQSNFDSRDTDEESGYAPPGSAASEILIKQKLFSTFRYAYFTSLAVGIAVVPVWLLMLIRAAPAGLRRTRPPDIVELLFVLFSTLPSVLTCMAFSVCYCSVSQLRERRRIWPAITFGIFSGLTFNAITTIEVIEYFFDW